tara:strand:- start:42 stop:353 length:312 start_codon:yes stop_codon:yes gene_type:complete
MPDFHTTFDDNVSRVYTTRSPAWCSHPKGILPRHRPFHSDIDNPMRELRELRELRERTIHSGALAAIDYIAEVYMPSVKTTQTQPCGDVEQTLREASGYEPTE